MAFVDIPGIRNVAGSQVNPATDENLTTFQFTAGTTTAPSKVVLVGGKTTDGPPQYQPLPLAAGGASVIVSGTITTTPSGTQDTNLKQINGTTVLAGSGATAAGSQRVTVAVDSATVAGSASLPTGSNTIGKVDQGAAGTAAASWFTKISDGTDIVGISTVGGAKALKVDVVQTAGSQTDETTFTPGTSLFTAVGGEVDDTATDTIDEGEQGAFRMTGQRALHTNLRNNSGTEIGTASNPVRTDPTGTTAQPVAPSPITGALQAGAEVAVDGTAGGVLIFTADSSAKLVVIQNVGAANMRIGPSGVTATTGIRIIPNGDWDFGGVIPTTNIYAIREGAVNTIALAQKMT